VFLDKSLQIVKGKGKLFELDYNKHLYMGTEDVKIFKDPANGNVKMIGTDYHTNDKIGIVYGDYDLTKSKLDTVEINPSFHRLDCEKNWVYFIYNGEMSIIYKWFPLTICSIDSTTTGNDSLLNKKLEGMQMPLIFQRVRGSTCGFSYKDEIWFICHIVSYETPRHYYHIFVVFDKNMEKIKYSAPFKFGESSIEYCLGLVVEDDRVLVTYSEWDRTTNIAVYDKKYIDTIICYK